MTNPRTILRDGTLALVPLVVVGAVIGGAWGALSVAVSGLAALANLVLIAWLSGGFLAAAAGEGEGAPFVALGFMIKVPVTLGVFAGLLALFDPISVVLGLSAAVAGLGVSAFLHLRRLASEPELPLES